jgi:hypothetical protein
MEAVCSDMLYVPTHGAITQKTNIDKFIGGRTSNIKCTALWNRNSVILKVYFQHFPGEAVENHDKR